jgi:hypothetical protein
MRTFLRGALFAIGSFAFALFFAWLAVRLVPGFFVPG